MYPRTVRGEGDGRGRREESSAGAITDIGFTGEESSGRPAETATGPQALGGMGRLSEGTRAGGDCMVEPRTCGLGQDNVIGDPGQGDRRGDYQRGPARGETVWGNPGHGASGRTLS